MPQLNSTPTPVRLALATVIVVALALAASTWHVYGHTWDEPEHLAAGLALIDHGHYDYDIQHPPLARLALAVGPYLAGARSQGKPPPDGRPEGLAVLYGSGHYDLYLTLARAGALPFLALLIAATYGLGRRVLAPWGAVLAATLLAATPVVLGHGALAALDIPAAATCTLALLALERWLDEMTIGRAVLLGLAVGLAVGTKLSAIPFLALAGAALAVLAVCARERKAPRRWAAITGQLLAVAGIVVVVLTLAYGGHFIYLTGPTHHYNQTLAYLFGYSGPVHDAAYAIAARVPVPEALQQMVGGIEALTWHNQVGHLSYLFGEVRAHGWWYFYLVALAVKTPLPLLLLGLAGFALLVRDAYAGAVRSAALPLVFMVLLAFVSLFSHINIGVRHVLVLYPLLAIGAAVALSRGFGALAAEPVGWPRTGGTVVLAGLVLWQLGSLVRAWPDYLPYFNELVREPRAVLVDSDLDWGQDLKRLRARLRELNITEFSIAYLGSADLAQERLPDYRRLKPDERARGWVAISELARIHAPKRDDWLAPYTPRERIGRSILLYYIPAEPR